MADHYRRIELPISIEEFFRLPKNAAYKYEYFDKKAVLTPRPKTHTAVLDLKPTEVSTEFDLRPICRAEIAGLVKLFHHCNLRTQPFASLDEKACNVAAQDAIDRVVKDDDGPLVEQACVQVFSSKFDGPIGAALVTLVPTELLTDPFCWKWKSPPPPNAIEDHLGTPHLTWIFVSDWLSRRGYGTAMLKHVVNKLHEMGFTKLASTFALDNAPSALWHWTNGFQLLPQMRQFWARAEKSKT
jgi:hypothetical protein